MESKIKQAGVYYSTTDYSIFKYLKGNRGVTDDRVNNIMLSIKNRGYIPNPILVNEKFEVIDGQGRLAVLRKLKMPVEYIQKEGLTIDDCISMNINSQNWNLADYIESYAERGYEDYGILQDLIAEHPRVPITVISFLLRGKYCTGGEHGSIKTGSFSITHYEFACETLEFLEKLLLVFKDKKRKLGRNILVAFAFCSNVGGADKERLLKIADKHKEKFESDMKIEYVINDIEDKYNMRSKEEISFITEYKNRRR